MLSVGHTKLFEFRSEAIFLYVSKSSLLTLFRDSQVESVVVIILTDIKPIAVN